MLKAKGQSIVEYTLLATLIIVSTIVMGPYLIRSVGAHFKLWQEAVDDTVNDRMQKVPANIPSPPCTCSDFVAGECGGHLQRSNTTCNLNERYYYKQCSPPTCGFETGQFDEKCQADPACCDVYNACTLNNPLSSCCGTAPLPSPTFSRTTTDPTGLPPVGTPNPNNPSSSCYYGEELLYNQCDITKIRCRPNDQCKAMCVGNLPHDASGNLTATLCPNADQGLTQDTPITYVNGCPAAPLQPPPPACYVAPLPTNVDTTFCFNNAGCVKVNCGTFSAGGNCSSAPSCAMPVYIPGYTTNQKTCTGTAPLNDDAASIIKFCQSLGFSSGALTQQSYTDDCGWVTFWNGSKWATRDEGDGGERRFAYKIKCLASPTSPTNPTNPTNPAPDCTGECPDYSSNPSATKCVAQCNPGFQALTDKDGNFYCSLCLPQTVSEFTDTSQKAGGHVEYTSPVSTQLSPFHVKVWTEDLNFLINFMDANGNILRQELCDNKHKAGANNHPNLLGTLKNSCGGTDDDDNKDTYEVTYQANQVYVQVLEGGDKNSGSFGYSITADICGATPSSALNCTNHAGAIVNTASGSGLVKGTCPAGNYLAGYCVKSTGGSDKKDYAREWARTMNSVSLAEGNNTDSENSVTFDYYCYPCTCGGKGCQYLPYNNSRTTSINHYSGNPTSQMTCVP